MPQIYRISCIGKGLKPDWNAVPSALISHYQWPENGYRPEAWAQACHDGQAIHVRLSAREKNPRAICTQTNDMVCCDSCLEFFVQASPGADGRYLNFEFNARGTMLLGLGHDRYHRVLLDKDVLDVLDVQPYAIEAGGQSQWGVCFTIPETFLRQIFPFFRMESGAALRGNFYKCGDETEFPHYASWNPVLSARPDFHRPEYFADLVLE